MLHSLILFWERVAAMSAKILFCWCKRGCGHPSLSKLGCTAWRYYCTQAAHCLPAPVHSLADENNHATTSDPAGHPETGALGGLNPLAILGANRGGKGPTVFLPAERGW